MYNLLNWEGWIFNLNMRVEWFFTITLLVLVYQMSLVAGYRCIYTYKLKADYYAVLMLSDLCLFPLCIGYWWRNAMENCGLVLVLIAVMFQYRQILDVSPATWQFFVSGGFHVSLGQVIGNAFCRFSFAPYSL